jgi:hypothetical protein
MDNLVLSSVDLTTGKFAEIRKVNLIASKGIVIDR